MTGQLMAEKEIQTRQVAEGRERNTDKLLMAENEIQTRQVADGRERAQTR